jgi:hypothetical protein
MREGIPHFGSDEWMIAQLYDVLIQIRKRIDEIHEELRKNPPTSVDFDAYHYACIPRQQKKVWKYLRSLAQQHTWIRPWKDSDVLDIEPSQPAEGFAAKAAEYLEAKTIVEELQNAGIKADLRGSYR